MFYEYNLNRLCFSLTVYIPCLYSIPPVSIVHFGIISISRWNLYYILVLFFQEIVCRSISLCSPRKTVIFLNKAFNRPFLPELQFAERLTGFWSCLLDFLWCVSEDCREHNQPLMCSYMFWCLFTSNFCF